MSAPHTGPLFRARIYPIADLIPLSPGRLQRITRPGVWGQWQTSAPGTPVVWSRGTRCQLRLDQQLSVLPLAFRNACQVHCDLTGIQLWEGQPVPSWRGIPCRLGTAQVQIEDTRGTDRNQSFRVQALIPDRDPPGPPLDFPLLGEEFLIHYQFRMALDYGALQFVQHPPTGRLIPAPLTPWGTLDIR